MYIHTYPRVSFFFSSYLPSRYIIAGEQIESLWALDERSPIYSSVIAAAAAAALSLSLALQL